MPNIFTQQKRADLGLSTTPPSSTVIEESYNSGSGLRYVMSGTAGADSITVSEANVSRYHYLFGFDGNDILTHFEGFYGMPTNSPVIMYGGAGADTFVLGSRYPTVVASGIIGDFSNADGDRIDISDSGLSFDHLEITTHGSFTSVTVAQNLNITVFGNTGDFVLTASSFITSLTTINDDAIDGTSGNDTFRALGGNDTVTGGDGNDTINGNMGDDSVSGDAGADFVRGGKGNDTVNGGDGNDSVYGDFGTDIVAGGEGDDVVRGGKEADTLQGGAGADTLYGDLGNDRMTGGEGADNFVFMPGHGVDVVSDFVSGTDHLVFSSSLFGSAAAAVAAFSGGTIATGVGSSVTLTGVTSITAADIILI